MRLLLLVALLACSCQSQNTIDPRVLTVPSVQLHMVDSNKVFNTASIKDGTPTVLVFFSPDCPYSQLQTKDIIANYSMLKGVHFYMCSTSPMQKLHDFSKHFQLNRFGNIRVGRDVNLFFDRELKVPGYPWLFLYAADKSLKRIATGHVEAKMILDLLKG